MVLVQKSCGAEYDNFLQYICTDEHVCAPTYLEVEVWQGIASPYPFNQRKIIINFIRYAVALTPPCTDCYLPYWSAVFFVLCNHRLPSHNRNCNMRNDSYIDFEKYSYVIIDAFQGLSFLFFFIFIIHSYCSSKNCKKLRDFFEGEGQSNGFKKCCSKVYRHVVGFLLISMIPITIALPLLGYRQNEQKYAPCKNDSYKSNVAQFHAWVQGFSFFSTLAFCLAFALVANMEISREMAKKKYKCT